MRQSCVQCQTAVAKVPWNREDSDRAAQVAADRWRPGQHPSAKGSLRPAPPDRPETPREGMFIGPYPLRPGLLQAWTRTGHSRAGCSERACDANGDANAAARGWTSSDEFEF